MKKFTSGVDEIICDGESHEIETYSMFTDEFSKGGEVYEFRLGILPTELIEFAGGPYLYRLRSMAMWCDEMPKGTEAGYGELINKLQRP